MRHQLLIKILTISLFCTNIIYGQVNCVYSHSSVFSGINIQFQDSNNFVYQYSDCTQSKIGYGKFERTKKKIKLIFKTVEPTKNSYVFKIDSTKNNSDSVIVNFKIQDELTKEGIFMSRISPFDSAMKIFLGTMTNENGIGRIRVKPDRKLINFKVTALGFKSVMTSMIVAHYNYEVTINMNDWTQVAFGDGDIIEYEIGHVAEDSIELKVGHSKYIDYKITCR